jgi:hypothetical protein
MPCEPPGYVQNEGKTDNKTTIIVPIEYSDLRKMHFGIYAVVLAG